MRTCSREFRLRATYGMDQELIDALTQRHIDLDDPNIAEVFAQREPIAASILAIVLSRPRDGVAHPFLRVWIVGHLLCAR